MVATDPGSIPDMKAWSKKTGHQLLESREENGLYWFYIKKMK
ncbi:MAG: sulfurtransferase TusA family protein [Nitrospiria bacterium]